ncbi:MAG: hypothetical protein E7610_02610 [Ruminococcaceae bacterium]|nr:hypothetical protein [Oscillospiraceae bacterium]
MDKQKKKLYVVSTPHLDTQWNWTIQTTIREYMRNTLLDNLELFKKYPHYRMNFEGAFRYKLAKEYYPEEYAQIKDYVAEGRWNVAGSQWDASDTNVPSSEAYMRQILLGNGFFESEFGKKSTDIFLTDCFGFRYSLPSIAAHMGLKGFSTQKLFWGLGAPILHDDGTASVPMPNDDSPRMDLGKWVGPDGNYVVGSLLPGGYTTSLDGDATPFHERASYMDRINHNITHAGVPAHMMYYGVGDFGGAPTEGSIRVLNEAVEQNGEDKPFEVISASTDQIFNELTPEQIDALPTYRGHLHIPHGYGTLTSRTISKRWNRKCELSADAVERAASMAKWLGKASYPKERLDFAWKMFLWHQFHDDLPGTSRLEAYLFTFNDYVIAQNVLADEMTASVDAVASALNTNVSGEPVVVYNPVSFARADLVSAPLPAGAKHARVYTADGSEVPSQCSISEIDGSPVVLFVAEVAPVSFTVFNVVASENDCTLPTDLSVSENSLENARYRVELNSEGQIASIFDKQNKRELLAAPSTLGIREDNNVVWPSWEIKYEDTKLPFTDVGGKLSMEIVEKGPAVVAIKVIRRESNAPSDSEYVQTIYLTAGGQRVNVDNNVDWHNLKSFLSAGFPLTVSNPTASFDLGLGVQEAGNTDSYPYFQHCVHQWADLSEPDGSFGVSILNDCKYGMEKPNDNTLRLSLIHTPIDEFKSFSAQNWQDHGKNLFRYAITSHGATRDGISAEAECLNTPLLGFTVQKHEGEGFALSFADTNTPEVTIRCIKEEEKGDRLIVRVQSTSAVEQKNVRLTLAASILSAVETNGYEEGNTPVAFDESGLTFDMTPYAVKTFALTVAGRKAEDHVGTPVSLAYNTRVTSPASDLTAGEFGQGISIPEELYEAVLSCGGLQFKLGNPGEANAVICRGQTVTLPAGTRKVAILAASANGDVQTELCGTPVTIRDFSADVGAWDLIACGTQAYINREPVAVSYSHTHDKDGDRPYKFANIFKYVIDVNGADSITLPEDERILVTAITAISDERQSVLPTAPLYDYVKEKEGPLYHFTAVNMVGSGFYHEGDLIRVKSLRCNENGVFEGFGGTADILWQDDVQALVRIGKSDCEIHAVFTKLGENVALRKPCRSHTYRFEHETPDHAFNGTSADKWAGEINDQHFGWLEVDLGEITPIHKILAEHCGEYEDHCDSTVTFRLECRASEEDDWTLLEDVQENHDYWTIHEFAPVNARYVRIYITRPTPGFDKTCRIYQMHVYKYHG